MTRLTGDLALRLPDDYEVIMVTEKMCIVLLLELTEEQLEKGVKPRQMDGKTLLVESSYAVKVEGTKALTIVPMRKLWSKKLTYELQHGGKKVAIATEVTAAFGESIARVNAALQGRVQSRPHLVLVKTATTQ